MIGKHIIYFKLDVFCVPETTVIKREKDARLISPQVLSIHSEEFAYMSSLWF